MSSRPGWLRQSVTGADNRTFEGAYLALFFIMALAGLSILSLLALGFVDVLVNKKEFNPAGLGGGISAVLGGLAAFLGGVGAYILMDRKQDVAPAITTTTTDTQSTVVKTVAAPAEAPRAPIVANGQVQPLKPQIGPEDVGKNVAIVSPSTKRSRK